jgi:hypothetical protein
MPEVLALEKSKIKAKAMYTNTLEHKKNLVFNECKKESEAYLSEYADAESYAWKYLYKTNVIMSKLF